MPKRQRWLNNALLHDMGQQNSQPERWKGTMRTRKHLQILENWAVFTWSSRKDSQRNAHGPQSYLLRAEDKNHCPDGVCLCVRNQRSSVQTRTGWVGFQWCTTVISGKPLSPPRDWRCQSKSLQMEPELAKQTKVEGSQSIAFQWVGGSRAPH